MSIEKIHVTGLQHKISPKKSSEFRTYMTKICIVGPQRVNRFNSQLEIIRVETGGNDVVQNVNIKVNKCMVKVEVE